MIDGPGLLLDRMSAPTQNLIPAHVSLLIMDLFESITVEQGQRHTVAVPLNSFSLNLERFQQAAAVDKFGQFIGPSQPIRVVQSPTQADRAEDQQKPGDAAKNPETIIEITKSEFRDEPRTAESMRNSDHQEKGRESSLQYNRSGNRNERSPGIRFMARWNGACGDRRFQLGTP